MAKRDSPARRREILQATLKTLRHHGPSATTTAKIAAEANCSKETIYNWFGDRQGLFAALIEEQPRQLIGTLETSLQESRDIRQSLEVFAAFQLDLLTGEASLILNRIALAEFGTENTLARLVQEKNYDDTSRIAAGLLERARHQNIIRFEDTAEIVSTFFGLIIADRQIRAALGDPSSRPPGNMMKELAARAVERLLLIYR